MATYIMDNVSAGCDSQWSDVEGKPIEPPINKYLFIDGFVDGLKVLPSLTLYSGDYEQIVLHQAMVTGILTLSEYKKLELIYARAGHSHLSFVSALLDSWELEHQNIFSRQGVVFGGSGGKLAYDHYLSCYDVSMAIGFAIDNDPYSGHEINWFARYPDRKYLNFVSLDDRVYGELYDHTEKLCLALQSGEIHMSQDYSKYRGSSTSPSKEADDICLDEVVQAEQRRRLKYRQVMGNKAVESFGNQSRITPKKLSEKARQALSQTAK